MISNVCQDLGWINTCNENKGDHVEIEGERNWPGDAPPAPGPDDRLVPIEHQGQPGPAPDGQEQSRCEQDGTVGERQRCRGPDKNFPDDPPAPDAPVIPPLSERDVLAFAPAPPAMSTEPSGVALRGMPMNALTRASEHVAGGSLLGLPVTVTFVPESYTFLFGDGAALTVPHGGTTWDDLGVPDFTATETSHAYAERGTYTVTATVAYSAVVDFGQWGAFPVDGLVEVTSPGMSVRVVEAHTALVAESCAEDPHGPAC